MPRPARLAECHPDKTHYCKGLCRKCYAKALKARPENVEKIKQQARQSNKRYVARYPERIREKALKRRYGLSLREYSSLLEAQGGVCAICNTAPTPRLNVDHCHQTQQVRGILCQECNHGLGNFADSVAHLSAAISYLEKANQLNGL